MYSINLIFVFLILSLAWSSGFSSDNTIAKEIEDKAEYIRSKVHPVFNVSCSIEGKYYAGANETKTISVRETKSGKIVRKIKRPINIRAVEFSPSSKLLILGLFSGALEVWDIGAGKLLKKISSLGGPISDMEYSNDGKYFVVAGGMGNSKSIGIKIYDGNTLEELHFINEAAPYESISIDKKSKIFAVSSWHGISLYELSTGKLIDEYTSGAAYFDISLSNNAETLTFADYLGENKSYAVVLDIKRKNVVLSLQNDGGVRSAIISNDGSMIFVAGNDGVVGIFDFGLKEWLNHATPNGGSIISMSQCGNMHLITGHWHNAVNVIDIFTGNLLRSHPGG